MGIHRASSLLAILPNALETGLSEIHPEPLPLKVGFESKQRRIQLKILELRHGRYNRSEGYRGAICGCGAKLPRD